MKEFLLGALIFIGLLIAGAGLIALLGWLVSIMLNVVLVQIGLGTITTYGALCLTSGLYIIYKLITW